MYCTSGLLAYPPAPRMGSFSAEPVVYPSPAYAAPAAGQGYMPFGSESSAFYTPLSNEASDAWRSLSQTTVGSSTWHYDSSMCGYTYGTSYSGLDVRRKNATRESTSTLKAWLYEHIKNPYPTKGEKIMLAIITKMTLTQVSTWFANARRRLKKENKMQWSPRNRTDNDDNDKTSSDDDDDDEATDGKDGTQNQKKTHSDDYDDYDDDDAARVNSGSLGAPSSSSSSSSSLLTTVTDSVVAGSPSSSPSYSYSSSFVVGQHSSLCLLSSKASAESGLVVRPYYSSSSSSSFSTGADISSASGARRIPSNHLFYYRPSGGGGGGKCPRMSRSPSSSSAFSRSSVVDDSSDMKPRIWSLADVATSHHNRRQSGASGHVTLAATGEAGSDVAFVEGGVGDAHLNSGGSFQPWSNAGFNEDRAPRFTTASAYSVTAAVTSFPPQVRSLPGGDSTVGSGVGRVQRLSSTSGHYSCRLAGMITPDDRDVFGRGNGGGGGGGGCGTGALGQSSCVGLGPNAAQYQHLGQSSAIGQSVDPATGTAFRPFPRRLCR